MTTEYTPGDIAMILRCLRAQTEGPGPICPVCVHQAGLVAYEGGANTITPAGRIVLAIAAERNQLRSDLEAEFEGRTELRRAHGARDDETFGAFFMRIAKERDLWRLRCEWQEAIAVYESAWRRWNTASETGTMNQDVEEWLDTAEAMRDQAKAAYVAAGGVV